MDLTRQILLSIFCIAGSICGMVSCYEPVEGCLDPLSSNFQLDGDTDCDDCCEYPTATLSFNHKWNDEEIDTSLFYLNENRLGIRIRSSQFLTSQLFMDAPGKDRLHAKDSLEISCTPALILYNNLASIELLSGSARLEDVALEDGFNTLFMNLGISDCIANVDTTTLQEELTSANALEFQDPENRIYLTHKFELELDRVSLIQKEIILVNNEGLTTIQLDGDFTITRGVNLFVPIDVNYATWFGNLSLDDTDEDIKQKIIENSSGSFSLSMN